MTSSYKINDKESLQNFIIQNWDEINNFICRWQSELPIPIYSSVDVREGKFKFAPVDHNMYPAGFNNICRKDLAKASERFKESFEKLVPNIKQVAIIPESHTKNTFYLDHLHALKTCIENAGVEARIVSFDKELMGTNEKLELVSHSNHKIEIFPGTICDGKLCSAGITYDLAVLNHDQSNPIQLPWSEIRTQVVPTPFIGWYKRQKIQHFSYYHEVAMKFAEKFSIEPGLIEAKFKAVHSIDFNTKEGLEELANKTGDLLKELPEKSSIFIKASQGTYGMGISVVSSAEEVLGMNRKVRNKMDVGKNNLKFTSVLLQEGVETILKYEDMPAEVTIYLVGGKAIGGFMRANPLRGTNENLNAKGMVYQKFCLSEIKQNEDYQANLATYSVIARLSTIASAYEIKEVLK